MRVALDVMGGDHGPGPVVAGALEAAEVTPTLFVTLVGDRAQIEPLLKDVDHDLAHRINIQHASQVITMEDHPPDGAAQKAGLFSSAFLATNGRAKGGCHRLSGQHRSDRRSRLETEEVP